MRSIRKLNIQHAHFPNHRGHWLQTARQYLKSSSNYSSMWILFLTEKAKVYKELGDAELAKEEFQNAQSFYTQGINVKCKDDQLNVELYRCRWLSNCHLGKFILSSECKLVVLFTFSFHFLIKLLTHHFMILLWSLYLSFRLLSINIARKKQIFIASIKVAPYSINSIYTWRRMKN